jgi:hypothetical protein
MALTQTDFLAYSGYTSSQVNTAFLSYLLISVDNIIQDEIGWLFTLQTIDSTNLSYPYLDYEGTNMDLVSIEAWQDTNLTVQIGNYFNSTLTTLTLGKDYLLKRYKDRVSPGQPNPVVKIKMLTNYNNTINTNGYYGTWSSLHGPVNPKLTDRQFLRLTGTYGWQNGYPDDLQNVLYRVVKDRLEWNANQTASGGSGLVNNERSLTLSRTQALTPEITNHIEALSKSIYGDPQVSDIINKYKRYNYKNVRIS